MQRHIGVPYRAVKPPFVLFIRWWRKYVFDPYICCWSVSCQEKWPKCWVTLARRRGKWFISKSLMRDLRFCGSSHAECAQPFRSLLQTKERNSLRSLSHPPRSLQCCCDTHPKEHRDHVHTHAHTHGLLHTFLPLILVRGDENGAKGWLLGHPAGMISLHMSQCPFPHLGQTSQKLCGNKETLIFSDGQVWLTENLMHSPAVWTKRNIYRDNTFNVDGKKFT